jgi:hypothetical protein
VVFDLPGNRRVSVLWNGDSAAVCVRAAKSSGGAAVAIDKRGGPVALTDRTDSWQIELQPASAHFADDPDGYYFIGGDPVLLTEQGVPPEAPLQPLQIGCD